MICNFHVGQKVVLVESFGPRALRRGADEGVVLPVKGQIYTVREFDPDVSNGVVCIRLNEIVNGPDPEDGMEASFVASMFRPVVERKTDISVFTALLTSQPEQVPA
ncbi:hypothetical protein J2X76_003647 [Neorhizobium sp. 2083]|uniref:hypothetical protein n=1 Tax=Neorhizobium sp. 2083 TaxID=2817762 RepID=UPI00285B4120|nr:hypothetical protein [Neorhizobium sp. 2083]MDR6818470.1 hypothetical protein [Neorhizobium sp. 2083]